VKNIRVLFAVGSLLWASALPLAAFAASRGAPAAVGRSGSGFRSLFATLVYATGSVVCHQQAGRSFHWDGAAWPVCARCTGIYTAAALAVVALAFASAVASGFSRTPHDARTPRLVLALALVPTILTVAWEWTTGMPTGNVLRAAAGAPAGAAVAWIVMQSG
jgi:uncharacterized membrane protein